VEIGLIVLAIMLATLLGWLLKQSFNTTPWISEQVSDTAHHGPMGDSSNTKLIALMGLLAVVTSFFALMFSAYSLRMELGDWVPMTEPQLLWVNTGMLILASLVFQWTRNGAVKGQRSRQLPGLLLTGVLTLGFVLGQYIAWQQLQNSGQLISSNPANAFFYFMTGAHALHVLGGLYVWARATIKVVLGTADDEKIRRSIELCTIYWHFLLLVWLILFGLLLST
jgi:cytochrome c oxidase subunit 3